MINHHPSPTLLNAYVEASLPVSLSLAVSIHLEMCSKCAAEVATIADQQAEACFEQNSSHDAHMMSFDNINIDEMINTITQTDDVDEIKQAAKTAINIKGKSVVLPRALSNIPTSNWTNIGKLSRSRLTLEDGKARASLLNIEPGGSVPEHTHKGFELTLLLSGSFSDDMGTYQAGDFMMLDDQHTHQPISEEGCLCFTVSNDAQHFTQGINKLLNPIAQFLY